MRLTVISCSVSSSSSSSADFSPERKTTESLRCGQEPRRLNCGLIFNDVLSLLSSSPSRRRTAVGTGKSGVKGRTVEYTLSSHKRTLGAEERRGKFNILERGELDPNADDDPNIFVRREVRVAHEISETRFGFGYQLISLFKLLFGIKALP